MVIIVEKIQGKFGNFGDTLRNWLLQDVMLYLEVSFSRY